MKKYNEEKAIISLTSWSARINTVSKTIFSLLKMCPEFHIVLVLSEEEFPKKEKELPENLMLIVNSDLIELLWVFKNTKAFKKVLHTIDKYRDVPVISADDDCIYLCNYAEILYNMWIGNKDCSVCFNGRPYDNTVFTWGCATLYPPFCFKENGIKWVDEFAIKLIEDDRYYAALKSHMNIPTVLVHGYTMGNVLIFKNEKSPLKEKYRGQCANDVYALFKNHIKI